MSDEIEGSNDQASEAAIEDAFSGNESAKAAPEVDQMAEMAAAMEVAAAEDAVNPAMNHGAGAGAGSGSGAGFGAGFGAGAGAGGSAEAIATHISSSDVDIETLLKVPVSLSIEVGRTKMPLSELLETEEGSVIELSRLLDEPLDILVNGALIAHGIVVLANERFGIQITDIISLQERVRSL